VVVPYLVVGFLILALVAYAAVNVGYFAFAAAMSVVNAVSSEPVIYLHDKIVAEATAGTTIRYEVVRLPDTSVYSNIYSTNSVRFEAENRSRWPISSITPRCTVKFADGNWADLSPNTRAERTRLDDIGYISTAVSPGGRITVSLPTERIRHDSPITRADCEFDLSVPWWMWASEMPRDGRS
jgi:hypothetical protein